MSRSGTFIPPFPQKPAVSEGAYDASRERLRRTAKYQRWVLLALLANILIFVVVMANLIELATIPSAVLRILGIVRLPICGFMTLAIVLLAKQFWNIAIVVICGLLMWVPIPGPSLIMLLIVNAKATRFLQQYGIKVGLLGVNPKSI